MSLTLPLLVLVVLCIVVLAVCAWGFDRLLDRYNRERGARRVGVVFLASLTAAAALFTFWACFALSAGLFQSLGLNLP